MRVLIMSDMEGVSGIVVWDQVNGGAPMYEEGRKLYTELLEQGCDACLLVGMHARAGTPDGVLCHTISTTTWRNLWFNDDLVGESGINAALCGHYGVPILLVTGDTAVCRETRELLGPGLTTVAVKRGLSRYSARQIPPVRARQMIEAGAERALRDRGAVKPYVPARP